MGARCPILKSSYYIDLSAVDFIYGYLIFKLQWSHNGRDGVSNHRHIDCLFNRLFRRRSNKTSKLRATGICEGNSPVTGEFPSQMVSNAENMFPFDDVILTRVAETWLYDRAVGKWSQQLLRKDMPHCIRTYFTAQLIYVGKAKGCLMILTCAWWRHQMETFSALLATYRGNSPVIGEFPEPRPVTRIFDVVFDLRLNEWLSKQS